MQETSRRRRHVKPGQEARTQQNEMVVGSPPASAGFLLGLIFNPEGQKRYASPKRPYSSLSLPSELKSNLNVHYSNSCKQSPDQNGLSNTAKYTEIL
jgi:hypothetical protein